MDYSKMDKDQLIEAVEQLQRLNRQLLEDQHREIGLDFAWTGNLGHWYWDIITNTVTFNPLKVTALGYSKEEIPEKVTFQFFTDKIHPEDYTKTMNAMRDHLSGKAAAYETEYRIRTKDGDYKWYYDRGKITQYDKKGRPAFLAGIVFDITEKRNMQLELEEKNKILARQATTDGLTGISNHRALIENLESVLDAARFHNKHISLGLFDIDNFKKVNDNKGHVYGDKVLSEVAGIIQDNIRGSDMAGRYGGEEFMVILSDTKIDEAARICERIRKSVEKHQFDDGMHITISGGAAEFQGETLTELVNIADAKLYNAKEKGKNRIEY